jgi:hypothetical protein
MVDRTQSILVTDFVERRADRARHLLYASELAAVG